MRIFFKIIIALLSISVASCSNYLDEQLDNNEFTLLQDYNGNQITQFEAQLELQRILNYLDIRNTRFADMSNNKITDKYSYTLRNKYTRSSDCDEYTVHIFNFENNNGFAIMSGDKRLPSLIALSKKGNLAQIDTAAIPGVEIFLNKMNYLKANKPIDQFEPPVREPFIIKYGGWENIVYKQGGMCNVIWGQNESPYNKYLPDVNGKKCLAGCVAIAVAQLMTIHKHPQIYDTYSFDWDAMTKDKYGFFCSSEAQDNIGRLIQQLGLSKNLNTEYGIDSSGASDSCIPRTLENFSYSCGGLIDNYETNKIVDELKQGYPVLVGGFCYKGYRTNPDGSKSYIIEGGHQWLVHGLLERRRKVYFYKYFPTSDEYRLFTETSESEWYPLCNWGWHGYCDGYYLSEVFNTTPFPEYTPDTQGTRSENEDDEILGEDGYFQFYLNMVTGIRK